MLAADALAELARNYWFDAVAQSLEGRKDFAHAHRLASVGQRVLALDAEDFFALAGSNRQPWALSLRRSGFPTRPRDSLRGAFSSMVELYELLLEALRVREARREPQQVVVVAHLIGEYLPQLAWQPVLGHGGDPAKLGRLVGERWGTDDPACAHSSAQRSTARRALSVTDSDDEAFTTYLDRFHSRLGTTLAVCGMNHDTIGAGKRPDVGDTCATPCRWATAGPMSERRALDARLRLALLYAGSPVVALRHHAPVGHFFGVPSSSEIGKAWQKTWRKLTQQWPDGANPLAGATPSGEGPLPGIEALVSAVAARPISAGDVLAELADDLAGALTSRRVES